MKTYKLYQIVWTNGIAQHSYVTQISANNIVAAEAYLESSMFVGNEYIITVSK